MLLWNNQSFPNMKLQNKFAGHDNRSARNYKQNSKSKRLWLLWSLSSKRLCQLLIYLQT